MVTKTLRPFENAARRRQSRRLVTFDAPFAGIQTRRVYRDEWPAAGLVTRLVALASYRAVPYRDRVDLHLAAVDGRGGVQAVARLMVAVAQSSITADPRANGSGIRSAMRRAAAHGARLIQFPEGALSGYAKEQIRT